MDAKQVEDFLATAQGDLRALFYELLLEAHVKDINHVPGAIKDKLHDVYMTGYRRGHVDATTKELREEVVLG